MDHSNSWHCSAPDLILVREPSHCPFVSMTEAITWIAFGQAMTSEQLLRCVEGAQSSDPFYREQRLREFFRIADSQIPELPGFIPAAPGTGHFVDRECGLRQLQKAWRQIRDAVELKTITVRGSFTKSYSLEKARLSMVSNLNGNTLATFPQFDVTTGGLRRQPEGYPSVMWRDHYQSFDREVDSFLSDPRSGDGYLLVEVWREDLMKAFPVAEPSQKVWSADDMAAWWNAKGFTNGKEARDAFMKEDDTAGLSESFATCWRDRHPGSKRGRPRKS
jgi:hypothetical protein